MVKEAMGRQPRSMKGLDEILKIPGAGEKCLKILVVGEYSIYHIPKGKILFFPQKRIFFDRKTVGFRHLILHTFSQAWDGQEQLNGDAGDEMGEGQNRG